MKPLKYSILFLIIIIGCESEVDNVRLPEFQQKLVIASFISPAESETIISVISNQRLFGDLSVKELPGKLSGTISDGTSEAALDTVPGGLLLKQGTLAIVPGLTYYLHVENDKGLKAEGMSTVPLPREFDLNVDTFSVLYHEPGYQPWREFKVNITFSDFPGEQNYFCIQGFITAYMTEDSSRTYSFDESLYFEKKIFNDSYADKDNKIRLSTGMPGYFTYYDSAFLRVYLLNTEKSYYLYHRSLENYNEGDNPFTEPTPVYSNIKGGFGIFTSYTIDSLIFRLK
jgi:hypothetical protein